MLDLDARPVATVSPRTLVVAPSWVGDTVMALPVLEALDASGRETRILAKPGLHPLLAFWRPEAHLLSRAGTDLEIVARLRYAECDEAVILPNSFRSAWLPWRAGIPWRWGYAGNLRSLLLSPAVRRAGGRKRPQVEDYAALLAALGVDAPATWVPRLPWIGERAEQGRALLARAGITPGDGPLVGLFPGAEFGPSKRWPYERWIGLAQALRREVPGIQVVLVAGPDEVWLVVPIHEQTGRIHPVVGPDLDLGRLASVLGHLDLLVTNDSGPMHVAAALGVACVALFGPTDPRRTSPAGEGHRVLASGRWCAPCFRRRCPLLHHGCMKDLGIEAVTAAAVEALGSDRTAQDARRR